MTFRVCVLQLLGFALRLSAAEIPAQLWLEFDRDGGQRLTLSSPQRLDSESFAAALVRATGCRPATLETEAQRILVTVNCGEPSSRMRIHSGFRLGELAPPLRQAGVSELEIVLMLPPTVPRLGSVDVVPASLQAAASGPVLLKVDSLPSEITVDAGFDGSHFATFGSGVVGILMLPWILRLFPPRDLVHLMAMVQALFFAGWGAWIAILLRSSGWILAERATGWSLAGPIAAAAPPLLAIWIGAGIANDRFEALLGGGSETAGVYRRSRTLLGAASVAFFLAVAGVYATESQSGVFAWALGGAGIALALVLRGIRAASGNEGSNYSLPSDHPLWPRILEFAAKSQITVRGVTILRMRQPVAFVLPTATITLSEGLLRRLSRAEADAVVCHELSHLTPQGRFAGAVLYIGVTATAMAAQLSPAAVVAGWIPIAIVGGWLSFKAWRRSGERKADLDAVAWSGNPEALITGLARVSNAAGMPMEWGAPVGWAMAHPSTGDRLRAIASAGAVTNSRLAELIEESHSNSMAADPYPLPKTVDGSVASTSKQLQTRLFWFSLLSPVVLGVGTACILDGAGTLVTLAAGLPGAMFALYLAYEWLVGQTRAVTRRLAVSREGNSSAAGIFVGFSPASEPRLFDGLYHLDCGLVHFSTTMNFVGENVRFALDPQHVNRIWIGKGPRHWTPRRVVYVECCDGRIFSLQSLESSFWPFTSRAASHLFDQCSTWRGWQLPSTEARSASDLPVAEGEPEPLLSWITVSKAAGIYAAIGWLVSSFVTAEMIAAPILCAALKVFTLWPRLRWRMR